MKSISKRFLAYGLATAVLTGVGSTLVYAGDKEHDGCRHGERFGPAAAVRKLDNLTPDQQAQLQQIRDEARDASSALREAMFESRAELRTAMTENADLDTIRSLAAKQGEQKTEMFVLRAATRDRINGVLTEEQRQQLAELRTFHKHDDHRHHDGMRGF